MRRASIFATAAFAALMPLAAFAQSRVLVFPFAALNDSGKEGWVGTVLQQNIVADLSRTRDITPVPYSGSPTADAGIALKAAQAANADALIYGTTQVVDDQTRMTALVVDTHTGQLLGTAKVTTAAKDLLTAEDDVSDQVRRTLLNNTTAAASAPGPATATSSTSFAGPAPAEPYPPNNGAPVAYTPGYAPAGADVSYAAPNYGATYDPSLTAGYGVDSSYYAPSYYPYYSYPAYYGGLYTSFYLSGGRYYPCRFYPCYNGRYYGGGSFNGYRSGFSGSIGVGFNSASHGSFVAGGTVGHGSGATFGGGGTVHSSGGGFAGGGSFGGGHMGGGMGGGGFHGGGGGHR